MGLYFLLALSYSILPNKTWIEIPQTSKIKFILGFPHPAPVMLDGIGAIAVWDGVPTADADADADVDDTDTEALADDEIGVAVATNKWQTSARQSASNQMHVSNSQA